MKRIFISSVQKEFALLRASLAACDIYLGLFGDGYGFEDSQGVSPTEHEFNRATELHKARLIYVTGDMIARCTAHGLQEPSFSLTDGFVTTIWRKPELALSHVGGETVQVAEQVTATPEVTPEVRMAQVLQQGEMSREALQAALGLKDEENFRKVWLLPALKARIIAMTLPDKPTSSKQKYRLTPKGRQLIKDKI